MLGSAMVNIEEIWVAVDSAGSTISDQAVLIGKTLASFGKDADSFFNRFGMKVENNPSPTQRFPATLMAEVWNQAEEEYQDSAFRHRVTSFLSPKFYHLLTPALINCASLGNALNLLVRCSAVISDAAKIAVVEDESTLHLTISEFREEKSAAALDVLRWYTCYIASFFNTSDNSLTKMSFSAPELEVNQQLWGDTACKIIFSAESDSIWFSRDVSTKVVTNQENRTSLEHFLKQYTEALKRRGQYRLTLLQQLEELLQNDEISLDKAAQRLNISSRTLQRRLCALKTCFQKELDATRCLKANEYLNNSSLSLTDIALLLGFTDASHFSNKFHTWTGLSPRKYRMNLNRYY